MVQYHLEFHRYLKSVIIPEELHQEGLDVDQVPGSDYFLKNSTTLLKENPKMRDVLYVLLICGVVANMRRNNNTTFSLKAYNVLSVSDAYPRRPLSLFLEIFRVRLLTVSKEDNLYLVKTCPSLNEVMMKLFTYS